MTTIEKKEYEQIHNTEYFQLEDKLFCENTFAAYNDHFNFLTAILVEVKRKFEMHKNYYPDFGPFTHEVDSLTNALDEITNGTKKLTSKFAEKIVNYFNTEYNLGIEVDKIPNKVFETPLLYYKTIIDEIERHAGPDLREKGKQLIIERFQTIFKTTSSQPVLNGYKISFPTLGSYKISSFDSSIKLKDDRDRLGKVLDAIALFSLNSTKRPETFIEHLREWRREINCQIEYNLLGGDQDVSLKFFKNNRIDLVWLSKGKAQKFWTMFDLENITSKKGS